MTLTTSSLLRHCRRNVRSLLPRQHTDVSASERLLSSSTAKSALSRYGLGGQNWKKFTPESYKELIYQALAKRVSYFEIAGQEGGDIAMVGAIQSALERNPEFLKAPVTITTRLGYRTLEVAEEEEGENANINGEKSSENLETTLKGDVVLSEEKDTKSKSYVTPSNVVHNLSSDYIAQCVQNSPLLELLEMEKIKLIFLLHNPEVQVVDLLKDDPKATAEERQEFIKQRWTPAMETLQEYSMNNNPDIFSFGVVSNGLGIPAGKDHPMHLDTNLITEAGKTYNQFSTTELPANLLETYGWEMARKIKSECSSMNVIAMRPLTCYPDLGTGSGLPFRLVDYALPALEDQSIQAFDDKTGSLTPGTSYRHTNEMSGIPAIYQMALQAAMSHFDAEELLETKQERDLTMEERETLDGCKLMQSMIHDLDNQLQDLRSFSAHEEELYGKIIPLIYDTFEVMDDKTSDVLQAYFAAYAVAVRYAIAKKTREVLQKGESGKSSSITYPNIPQSMTLQEFALRHMMAEKCFDRIVIGASTMQDFQHQSRLMEKVGSEESPLDVIDALISKEDKENEQEEEKIQQKEN